MNEIFAVVLTFLGLAGAAIGTMLLHHRLPPGHLQDDSNATIRLVANLFVVMTSLVLGLMMNSARNTFEAIDHNIHAYATELILLDRTVRALGPEADETHRLLVGYLRQVLSERSTVEADRTAERLLEEVGNSLRAIRLSDDQLTTIWNDARQIYGEIVRQRWVIVEQSEGTLPRPLLVLVITWLVLIFASFGYRAPQNATVITMVMVAALLMAASISLMLDMDAPSDGLIRPSDQPFRRALSEIEP